MMSAFERLPTNDNISIIELLPNDNRVCFVIKGLFEQSFCEKQKKDAINSGFTSANNKYPTSYRNNNRLVKNDTLLANFIYRKCAPFIPYTLKIEDKEYTSDSLNNHLRYCQYSAQQHFSIHRDGVFHKDDNSQSVLTFLLYLNDTSEFSGGETAFYTNQHGSETLARYTPGIGDVAVFDHTIWHSGNEVHSGHKYILRSDFIYTQTINKSTIMPSILHKKQPQSSLQACQHKGYIWKTVTIDEHMFASASRDKSIKIWDKNLHCLQVLTQHQNSVFDVAIDTKKSIYAVSRDGHMTKWEKKTTGYHLKWKIDTQHPCVLKVMVLPNQNILTSGSDGVIRLWKGNKKIDTFRHHNQWVWSLITKDTDTIISCDANGLVNIIDIATGAITHTKKLDIALRCMAINKSDLFIGDEQGNIQHLDASTLEKKQTKHVHTGIVRDILTTDNGLISCGEDNKVMYSDYRFEAKKELYCHSDFATSLSFFNHQLLSSSYSGKIAKITLDY